VTTPQPALTFAVLHDRMVAAGCWSGIAFDGTDHRLVIDDPDGRRIAMTVHGSFDQTARVLVLSGGLRELLGRDSTPPPPVGGTRSQASGTWPELLELARTAS